MGAVVCSRLRKGIEVARSNVRARFFLARICNSRFLFLFFTLSVLHFALQFTLRAFLVDVDRAQSKLIETTAHLPQGVFVTLEDNSIIKACNEYTVLPHPTSNGSLSCPIIYPVSNITGNSDPSSDISAFVGGLTHSLCDVALLWPFQTFQNSLRTDVAFMGLELWLLIVSATSILSESIPHLVASIAIRVLSTLWALFMIFETKRYQLEYQTVIIDGVCSMYNADTSPLNPLQGLYTQRFALEVVVFVLNLLILAILSWIALRIYGLFQVRHFSRVGADEHLEGIYKLVLALSASFQVSAFVLITSTALWIHQLYVDDFHIVSNHLPLYRAAVIATLAVLAPWLLLGHFAVRKEKRWMMILFLIISLALLAWWSVMFSYSPYQVLFVTWAFFATMTVASFVLIVMTFILGILCRRNFGKGLAHYLHVQRVLADSDFPAENFSRHTDSEKGNTLTMKSFIQRPEPIKLTLNTISTKDEGRYRPFDFDEYPQKSDRWSAGSDMQGIDIKRSIHQAL